MGDGPHCRVGRQEGALYPPQTRSHHDSVKKTVYYTCLCIFKCDITV